MIENLKENDIVLELFYLFGFWQEISSIFMHFNII